MIKIKIKSPYILAVVFALMAAISGSISNVALAGEGGSTGGGGKSGCSEFALSTCYGATWRYYTTTSDDVYINGYTSYDNRYARAEHITGCGKYGGYWRYAMVGSKNSSSVTKGEQFGVIGISGNDSNTFNSEFLGGGMNYIPKSQDSRNADWNEVKAIYEALQKAYPTEFTKGFGKGSDLAWFCGPDDPDEVIPVEYYSKSDATATTVSGVTTGIQKDKKTATTSVVNLTVGDTLEKMTFTHNVYASVPSNGVSWSVERSGFLGSVFYTIGEQNSVLSSGTVNVTRSYPDGGSAAYISTTVPVRGSEYKNIKFLVAGSYEFCEEILVNGKPITKSCVKVNVSSVTGYGSSSHVSNRTTSTAGGNSGDYLATDIYPLKGNKRYVETGVIKLDVGESANMTFSHNIYASRRANNVGWKVTREVASVGEVKSGFDSSDYSIAYDANGDPPQSANSSAVSSDGVTNISEANSGIYIANTRPYTDGELRYVHRDFYRITFNKEGTYRFCEYVYVGDVLYTYACSTVEVRGDSDDNPGDCAQIGWLSRESGVTSVASAVRDISSGTGWRQEVYAKPTDDVEWLHCYYPGVQDRAYDTVTRYHYTHSTYDSAGAHPNTNVALSSFNRWENRFTVNVTSGNFTSDGGLGTRTLNFSIGDSGLKSLSDPYEVQTGSASKVGRTLTEKITSGYPTSVTITNNGDHNWTCDPYDCSYEETYTCGTAEEPATCTRLVPRTCYRGGCNHGNEYITSSRSGTDTDNASVYVPYNFINNASIEISDANVYAGEKMSFDKITVETIPKYNSVTKGTYATRVDSARVRVVTYSSRYDDTSGAIAGYGAGTSANLCSAISGRYTYNNCNEVSTRTRNLNNPENIEGATETGNFGASTSYDAYDVPAGEYICFVVGVYPYTSGVDTQMEASGDNSWYISRPSCHVVAKRPSFQVWGGGISAVGSVTVSAANKGMLHIGETSGKVPDGIISFGSWVEQESVTTGATTLLSTGAATGVSDNLAGGGSLESSSLFCKYRVPLSFANFSNTTSLICSRSLNSTRVGYSGVSPATLTKDAMVNYLLSDVNATEVTALEDGTIINLGDSDSYNVVHGLGGGNFRYSYGTGNLSLSGGNLGESVTHVVKVDGNIALTGDLQYATANYGTLAAIPKLIIYAKNITIGCSVRRIDAILIADENLTTCESEDLDSRESANPLIINGAIIAGSLSLGRTYGATVGTGSSVPAEVINYDTSTLLWEKGFAGGDSKSGFTAVYQKEIAPRY